MIQNSVLDYLESTVKQFPNKEAIITEENRITFAELHSISCKAGLFLSKKLNMIRQPVFVSVDRSERPIIGFLAVLYSGNYYVPIDINTPKDRLKFMMESVQPAAFIHFDMDQTISEIDDFQKIEFIAYEELMPENDLSQDELEQLSAIRTNMLDVDPCYVLFTSGSTGDPKGVVISHRMVRDLTDWLNSITAISTEDVIANQTPFYFDASVKDIYQMLKTGAGLVILKPQLFVFTKNLIEFLNKEKVTVVLWASSAITMVANSGIFETTVPKYLKTVTFAGEQLFTKHLNIWRKYIPDAKYINLYGPTETTVDCLYYIVDRDFSEDEIIPLGKACFNKQVFLLDDNQKPVQEGIGELYVRGTGVGLGYFADQGKTKSAYIQNPMHNHYRDIVYRTGDLAYLNQYGEFVFASRKDNQIKLNGHRIELGEIEYAMSSITGIEDVACIFDAENDVIIGYYSGEELSRKTINREMINKIPKYMIPAKYINMPEMPLTANGKIDKLKLERLYNKAR